MHEKIPNINSRGILGGGGKPMTLKAPFPYFGGKSKVSSLVWQRLGDVDNFIEPFCGSAAFLLARPTPPRIETLNDMDCYVANFWRSTSLDPEAVATHADHPVNEADLHARHRWLVLSEAAGEFRSRMRSDPDYFDAKVAGWWCWGICCWIGSGWCQSPESAEWDQKVTLSGRPQGMGCLGVIPPSKRPILTGFSDKGVHAKGELSQHQKRPQLRGKPSGSNGMGVNASEMTSGGHRPQLADAYARGRGVHGNDSAGTCEQRRLWLLDWFNRLRDRLRTVRVCCGDWRRVCDSPSVTTRLGITGLFLDPPYGKEREDGTENRDGNLYSNDKTQDVNKVVKDVRAYCLERGPDPMMRIALCGYAGEGHEALESAGWEVVAWKASGGYGNRSARGKENAALERIWYSPACLKPGDDCPLFKE